MKEIKFRHFKLPQSILKQLTEMTSGFHLVTINDQNEFETYVNYSDSVTELAIINYLDIQSTSLQERIRMRAMGANDDDDEEEQDA